MGKDALIDQEQTHGHKPILGNEDDARRYFMLELSRKMSVKEIKWFAIRMILIIPSLTTLLLSKYIQYNFKNPASSGPRLCWILEGMSKVNLKRRPIHEKEHHLDEKQSGHRKIYPKLEDEDKLDSSEEQCDENRINHRDGVRKKEKLKKNKGGFYEKAINALEENDKSKKEKVFNSPYATSIPYLKIVPFLLIIFVVLFFFSPHKPATELSLKEKLQSMQDLFKDQNHMTFRILEKALNKVVNVIQEPSAPAIITVTVNKNARYKSHEFSLYLARAVAPRSTIFINESVSWENNPDDIKLKIDNKIQSVAKEENLFVVIVDNLQNIPLKSAMIFHSFCDHEAAPFKKAVFLFIVPLDEILSKDATIKKIDTAASQQLKNIWNKATSDEIDSLITRITVNVINITH